MRRELFEHVLAIFELAVEIFRKSTGGQQTLLVGNVVTIT